MTHAATSHAIAKVHGVAPRNEMRNAVVQEVALVPFAANARVFPVVKSGETMPLKMNSQAQKTAVSAATQLMDKLSAITSMISTAEIDETAQIPVEIGKSLEELGTSVLGLAKQYGGEVEDDEKKMKRLKEEAKKAALAEVKAEITAEVEKSGRVLSTANMQHLRTVQTAVNALLASAEPPTTEDPKPQDGAAPAVAPVAKSAVTPENVQEMITKSVAGMEGRLVAQFTAAMQAPRANSFETPPPNSGGGSGSGGKPPPVVFPRNLADLANAKP